MLGALEDQVKSWYTFKRETLKAAKGCIGDCLRSQGGFASAEVMDSIEKSQAARLSGKRGHYYRVLLHRTKTPLRRDKETNVRTLAENIETHLNANDLQYTIEP